MASIFRVCFVLIPLLLSIATVVLSALAIAGSAKNVNPLNKIYLFKLDLTDAVTSELGASTSSNIYTFGMWGYCKGSSDDDITSCSDPKAMYIFDPLTVLEDDLGVSDISLPDKVESYLSTAKIVSKLIFITGIIGVCTAFLTGLFTILSFCSHGMSCMSMIVGFISFLSLVICAAASTGAFELIKKYFNDSTDTYGITATLSDYYYYGLIWGAAVAALITSGFNMLAVCCGRTSSRSRGIEEEPMMAYEEKIHH